MASALRNDVDIRVRLEALEGLATWKDMNAAEGESANAIDSLLREAAASNVEALSDRARQALAG